MPRAHTRCDDRAYPGIHRRRTNILVSITIPQAHDGGVERVGLHYQAVKTDQPSSPSCIGRTR